MKTFKCQSCGSTQDAGYSGDEIFGEINYCAACDMTVCGDCFSDNINYCNECAEFFECEVTPHLVVR